MFSGVGEASRHVPASSSGTDGSSGDNVAECRRIDFLGERSDEGEAVLLSLLLAGLALGLTAGDLVLHPLFLFLLLLASSNLAVLICATMLLLVCKFLGLGETEDLVWTRPGWDWGM